MGVSVCDIQYSLILSSATRGLLKCFCPDQEDAKRFLTFGQILRSGLGQELLVFLNKVNEN